MPKVLNVSSHGFWLLPDGEELFLSFDHFSWLREASIRHPENFPLISRP